MKILIKKYLELCIAIESLAACANSSGGRLSGMRIREDSATSREGLEYAGNSDIVRKYVSLSFVLFVILPRCVSAVILAPYSNIPAFQFSINSESGRFRLIDSASFSPTS